jgi:hypothetical protein
VVERAQQAGRHRIRYWNQVGFWVKADFASGSAAKDLQRLDPRTLAFFAVLRSETAPSKSEHSACSRNL